MKSSEEIFEFVRDRFPTIFWKQGYVERVGGRFRLRWREHLSLEPSRLRSMALPDAEIAAEMASFLAKARELTRGEMARDVERRQRIREGKVWLRGKLADMPSRSMRRKLLRQLSAVLGLPDGRELIGALAPWDQPLPARGRPPGREGDPASGPLSGKETVFA